MTAAVASLPYGCVDGHKHQRQDSGQLYKLLTYKSPPRSTSTTNTKGGSVAKRRPHQDPPGHFYAAQLLHYGLPPAKSKEAAKKNLLAAFGTQRELGVPKHLLELEKLAKSKVVQAIIPEVKKSAVGKRHGEQGEGNRHKKQKCDDDAIMQEFVDAGIIINTGAQVDDLDLDGLGGWDSEDDEPEPRASNSQLQKGIAALSKDRLSEVLTDLVFRIPAAKKAVIKELEKSSAQSNTSKGGKKILINDHMGEYQIVAPYMKDLSPRNNKKMKLEVSLSQKGSHLWAQFDFNSISGVMRSCGPPPRKVGDACRFIWRGQEEAEGRIHYGEDNFTKITFLGDGRVKGEMLWSSMGTFQFIGKKVKELPRDWAQNAGTWKGEWRSMNEHNYGFVRWGGGPSPDEYEPPRYVTPRSDTDSDLYSIHSPGWSEDSES